MEREMTKRYAATVVTCLLLTVSTAIASQELIVPWSSFTIASDALGATNPIELSGRQSDGGLSRLVVKAFGREFVLDKAQLRRLEGMSINGLDITYERGYAMTGGRTLYLVFSRGLQQQRISLTERGDITIDERAHR
jgi:hypothetical protein